MLSTRAPLQAELNLLPATAQERICWKLGKQKLPASDPRERGTPGANGTAPKDEENEN